MQRGSFQMMKSVNKSLILNKIRMSQPISRAQIAKEVKLTPPTVSSIVKELIEENLVKETKLGESKGGRKPTMLQINSEHFNVIGIDIGPSNIHCLLSDLSGRIVEQFSMKVNADLSQEQFLNRLINITKQMIGLAPNPDQIVGIGIAMHGVVDVASGTSLFAPNLKLKNIPIKDTLESEFDLTVSVENDARAMALGESWFGNHTDSSSMLVLNLSNGVGAGAVVNGKLYHGYNDIAGEVGHMTIDLQGPICECGNKGCLQTFATGKAIVREANAHIRDRHFSTAEEVYHEAIAGNKQSIEVLEKIGSYIGIGLTNLIHIINPETIILGGGVTRSSEFLMPIIKEEINRRALTDDAKNTIVKITSLGKNATLLGAIALILNELFEPL